MNVPPETGRMAPDAGTNPQHERRWGLIGGAAGSLAGLGALLSALASKGTKLSDLAGSPYPPFFKRRTILPLDFYFLALVVIGGGFLIYGIFAARRGAYPRTDASGAILIGAILSILGGTVLFLRLWAVLHA